MFLVYDPEHLDFDFFLFCAIKNSMFMLLEII